MMSLAHMLAQSAPPWSPWPERHRDVVSHWSDAFNCMDLIPGPPFLLLFIVYAAAAITFCYLLRNLLLSTESSDLMAESNRLPFSLKPGFLEIAYLQGGRRAVLTAAVCNLYRLGILTRALSHAPAIAAVGRSAASAERASLTPLESAISLALDDSADPATLAHSTQVRRELDKTVASAREKLGVLGLTPTPMTWLYTLLTAALAFLLVPGLAVIRVIRSELRGYHNVQLLVLLIILASVLIPVILFRIRTSGAGRRYLCQLQADARPIIRSVQTHSARGTKEDSTARHGPEVMYALAACGVAAFAETAYLDIQHILVPPRPQSSWNDWSSNNCSSCSGGSCGGGGCGGGGCGGGGCGGGGCGGG